MADIKKFAEELVNLSVKDVQELAKILKDEYGIEPAAAAVAVLPTAFPALATVPPAAFPLLIIPAPPAETIESAIDGTIKIPIPVTMYATAGNNAVCIIPLFCT